jgi:hypothetical protein
VEAQVITADRVAAARVAVAVAVAVEEDAALSQSVWGEGGINHFLPSEPEIRTVRYPEPS